MFGCILKIILENNFQCLVTFWKCYFPTNLSHFLSFQTNFISQNPLSLIENPSLSTQNPPPHNRKTTKTPPPQQQQPKKKKKKNQRSKRERDWEIEGKTMGGSAFVEDGSEVCGSKVRWLD